MTRHTLGRRSRRLTRRVVLTLCAVMIALTLTTARSATGWEYTSPATRSLSTNSPSLTGTVTGAILEGVVITMTGPDTSTTFTDALGNFSFTNVPVGTYVVTADLVGYAFTPPSRTVTLDDTNQTLPEFVAARIDGAVIYVNHDATGAGTGRDWDNAFTDLQRALAIAATGHEIWVAAGVYSPGLPGSERTASFAIPPGVHVYGGFAGAETTRTKRDPATNVTILTGDFNGDDTSDFMNYDENAYHVVTGSNNAVLDGFTITGGNANGASPYDSGGGMANIGVSPAVTNCIFIANQATGDGGGMFNADSATVTITGCLFQNNLAGTGGGMANRNNAPTAIKNCRFIQNSAQEDGGAVSNSLSSRTTIKNSVFYDNISSRYGGAVSNVSSGPVIVNCTFYGNTALKGGALSNNDNCAPTIINTILWNNTAGSGNEIYNAAGCVTDIGYSDVYGGITGPGVENEIDAAIIDAGGNINANPKFADVTGRDLKLTALSPCIDAANGDAATQTDIDGNARMNDPGMADTGTGVVAYVDIGAYEFQESSLGYTLSGRVVGDVAAGITVMLDGAAVRSTVTDSQGAFMFPNLHSGDYILILYDSMYVFAPESRDVTIAGADVIVDDTVAYRLPDGKIIYVNRSATGQNTGVNWTDAYCDLSDALNAAEPGDHIYVAAGTYVPGTANGDRNSAFYLAAGVNVYGGFNGTETSIAQRDWTTHVTVLSGDLAGDDSGFTNRGDNVLHVVIGDQYGSNALLDGFTISGGNADGGSSKVPTGLGTLGGDGAGVLLYKAATTIRNCVFTMNTAGDNGGAISVYASKDTLVLENCTFEFNTAGDNGGAVSLTWSPLSVRDSTFRSNVSGGSGGAVWHQSLDSEPLSITVFASRFTDNTAQQTGGGFCNDGGSLSASGCRFIGNTTGDIGGGVVVTASENSVLTNCILAENAAGIGGGLAFEESTGVITNCTITGNVATVSGAGGIHARASALQIRNSILWNDTAPESGREITGWECDQPLEVGYSIVQNGFTALGVSGPVNYTGGVQDTDPAFIDDSSDPYRLRVGSPAVDAGDGDAAPLTDCDGAARFDDAYKPDTGTGTPAYTDLGAREFFGVDSDNDGLYDAWELAEFGDLTHTADADDDGDGLSNITECYRMTDPLHADSDGDGTPDGQDPDPLAKNRLPATGMVSNCSLASDRIPRRVPVSILWWAIGVLAMVRIAIARKRSKTCANI